MKTENSALAKNIVLFGPESSGKTTLCKELSENFQGAWVPEYLRQFCESEERLPLLDDMPNIFKGQSEIESYFQNLNHSFLFFDTNPLQLMVYHQFYFETGITDENAYFYASNYHLYLLCQPDLVWENDPLRDMPERRLELYELFRSELDRRRLAYRIISGIGKERTESAIQAVNEFFSF